MRTVFSSHAKCAHVWAAQTQAEGRSGPLFFRDSTIYSYGGHYAIARFIAPDLVFFNDTGSSATTQGKHKPAVLGALHGHAARVIRVGSPTMSPREAIAYLATEYATALEKAARARTHSCMHLEYADRLTDDIHYLATRFNETMPALSEFDRAAIGARCAAQWATQKKHDATQAQLAAEHYAIDLAVWRVHGDKPEIPGRVIYSMHDMPTALRLSRDGASVETSRGASVPKRDAFNLWRLITMRKASAQAWRPTETMAVGSFQLREILANGDAIVGCHTLTYAETSAFAAAQGWAT